MIQPCGYDASKSMSHSWICTKTATPGQSVLMQATLLNGRGVVALQGQLWKQNSARRKAPAMAGRCTRPLSTL